MKKWLLRLLGFLLLVVVIASAFVYFRLRDRHAGYWLELEHTTAETAPIRAGFSAISITPEIPDKWTDVNNDARYKEEDGDTYEDGNNNGRFDPVWIAGFHNQRPAQGVHDELWARTMVLDDGQFRLAYVVLDAIGYFNDDIIAIRKKVSPDAGVDYIIVSSTHTHEGPDLLGLWGPSHFKTGVDPAYRQFVIDQAVQSVEQAAAQLRPARLTFAQDLEGAAHLVMDSREPKVTDPGIRILHATDLETNATLGTLVCWANHPETLWSDNLLLSSDFPHYVREGMENGIVVGDSTLMPGVGGITIYTNGSIGGLMTTRPDFGIPSLWGDTIYQGATYEKTEAQGLKIAQLALAALQDSSQIDVLTTGALSVSAKSISVPMQNPLYRLGAAMGVFDRGMPGWWKVRSELAYWQIGPAAFMHHPAEIYPEIVNGGVEAPEGGDFASEPFETPPLRSFMTTKYQFVVGLSNDMIGYAVPKSQWDEKPPYTYGRDSAPYGEVNSMGPETAPILYREMRAMLEVRMGRTVKD